MISIPGLMPSPAEARLLPEGRLAGPMPWIIGIMLFLTVLAAAAGFSMVRAAGALDSELAGRLTVQVVEANAARRSAQVVDLDRMLLRHPAVASVKRVPDAEIARMLEPWFGAGGIDPELPVPALIDVTLKDATPETIAALRKAVRAVAPAARVDPHADWLAPLARLFGSLSWLALLLVLLTAAATASIVVLSARAALNTHQATIEVMHLLGATDLQITELFQRKIARDALIGGGAGMLFALITMFIVGSRAADIGAGLLGTFGLGWLGWIVVLLLPIAGAGVATLAARFTIVSSLRRIL